MPWGKLRKLGGERYGNLSNICWGRHESLVEDAVISNPCREEDPLEGAHKLGEEMQ